MNTTIFIQLMILIIYSVLNRSTITLNLTTASIFTAYYVLMLKFFYSLFPHFQNYWNGVHLWPVSIFGLPLEEIAWATTYSLAWIPLIFYYLNIKVIKKENEYLRKK